ncbi:MAG: hypothetical protein E7413_04760 [Ruminococcaceae bacterium]|nr:hypothetical protein [Oscillospiraceae bacterium]
MYINDRTVVTGNTKVLR